MRFPLRSLPVGAATWLLLTGGCTAMRTVERADLSPRNPPTRVWVTRVDHSTVVFDWPRMSADSLIGEVNGWPERLPLSEVAVLRVREAAPDRTAGLVFLGVSGVVALAVYLVDKTPDFWFCNYYCPDGTTCCRGGCCRV